MIHRNAARKILSLSTRCEIGFNLFRLSFELVCVLCDNRTGLFLVLFAKKFIIISENWVQALTKIFIRFMKRLFFWTGQQASVEERKMENFNVSCEDRVRTFK